MEKILYDKFMDWFRNDGKTNNSIWFYSDPHFGDLDSYMLRFPNKFIHVTVEEAYLVVKILDEIQIKNINSKCGKNDTIVILGDVGDVECVKKIKARRKILITGNHDRGASYYLRHFEVKNLDVAKYLRCSPNDISFDAIEKYPDDPVAQEQYEANHYRKAHKTAEEELKQNKDFIRLNTVVDFNLNPPFISWKATFDNKLFDEVYDGALIISPKIILSHEPVIWPYGLNIHGHVHLPEYYGEPGHLNVCADQIHYVPICITDILKQGKLKFAMDIHRETIDRAILNKQNKYNQGGSKNEHRKRKEKQ